MRLGSLAAPDLLFVGLSSTDYYGHPFGPDSKEIADGMVRLDATLESFFAWLDGQVGADRALVFLTRRSRGDVDSRSRAREEPAQDRKG